VDTEGGCHGVVLGTKLALWRSWGKKPTKSIRHCGWLPDRDLDQTPSMDKSDILFF